MPPSATPFDFPKIDLYRRLGGSLAADSLAELGVRDPVPGSVPGGHAQAREFQTLQAEMTLIEGRLAGLDVIPAAVRAVADGAQRAGVRHAEMAVALQAWSPQHLTQPQDILKVLARSVAEYAYPASPSLGWLIWVSLDEPVANLERSAELAAAGKDQGVLGLAVRTSNRDSEASLRALAETGASGVSVVLEFDPALEPGLMADRLETAAPRRIVFGQRLIQDLPALAWIREHRPSWVVCASGERILGLGNEPSDLSLQPMIQAGMQVGLGSWAPALLGEDLGEAIQHLLADHRLSMETMLSLMLAGVQASLLGSRPKRDLERELEAAMFGFPTG